MEIREIIQRMNDNIIEIARHLLPAGNLVGHEWTIGNIHGEQGKSLKICTSGCKTGLWSDFATGNSGDLLELWKAVRGESTTEAIKSVKQYLNIFDEEKRFTPSPRSYKKPTEIEIRYDGPEKKYLTDVRKLTDDTIQKFKVGFQTGKLYFPYYKDRQLVNYKLLPIKKEDRRHCRTAPGAEKCLFGWHTIDDDCREVTICEGELDALSLYQFGFTALSVPFGAGTGNKNDWIENDLHMLDRFDKIYICMDDDGPGQEAAKDISQRLGYHRCLNVRLPRKDANDCLMSGLDVEEIACQFDKSSYISPANLKDIKDFDLELFEEINPISKPDYYSPGFHEHFSNLRFSPGELTLWGGHNGVGKTSFLMQLALDGVSKNEKFCIASLEQPPKKYLKKIIFQANLTKRISNDQIAITTDWLSGKIYIYDHLGNVDREDLLDTFEYAYRRYGIKHFVIDSLLKCGFGEDDYNGQKLFAEELTNFAIRQGVHIHLIAHLRKKDSMRSEVSKLDIRGTAALTDLASNVIIIVRNKISEKEKGTKPDTVLSVQKQRELGWEGTIKFMFDPICDGFHEKDKLRTNYLEDLPDMFNY